MPKITPALLLRFGLAFTFLYAAISGFIDPESWIGFFPEYITAFISPYILLTGFGILEIILSLAMILDKYTFYAAHLYALIMMGIIIATPNAFIITFRDIGLAFAALALAMLSNKTTS